MISPTHVGTCQQHTRGRLCASSLDMSCTLFPASFRWYRLIACVLLWYLLTNHRLVCCKMVKLNACLCFQVSSLVCFLLTPAAKYIAGQTIYVDGGYNIFRAYPIEGYSSKVIFFIFSTHNLVIYFQKNIDL